MNDQKLARVQGVFDIATGLWPILHRPSFERVSGYKVDYWLVRTTGGLITTIGAALLVASRQKRLSPEAKLLAIMAPATLALIDVVYVARRRISPVYLVDAAIESTLVICWLTRKKKRRFSS
jgi:hypothetical protein